MRVKISAISAAAFGAAALAACSVDSVPSDHAAVADVVSLSSEACAAVVAANSQAGILTSINGKVIVYEPVEALAVKPLCDQPGNAVTPLPSSSSADKRATVAHIPQELCKEVASALAGSRDRLVRVNGQRVLQGHPDQTSALNFCRQGRNDVDVDWGVGRPTGIPSWPATSNGQLDA